MEQAMNVNVNTSIPPVQNASATVGLYMLKKSMDIEAQNAMALINAIPQAPQSANPSSKLGQNINTTA
jgi:Putative motility protein